MKYSFPGLRLTFHRFYLPYIIDTSLQSSIGGVAPGTQGFRGGLLGLRRVRGLNLLPDLPKDEGINIDEAG